jgi:hypothetical protein
LFGSLLAIEIVGPQGRLIYNLRISAFEVDFMKPFVIVLVCLLLVSACLYAQTASAAPLAVAHGAFPVKIVKTLDSSKLKQDDAVEVETSGSFKLADGTLVPKGSKLEGHVVSAKARSKGDPDSELTLAFNKLTIAGGKTLSLNGSVQAVFPPADDPMGPNMATAGTSAGGSGAGGSSGGVGLTDTKSGSNMQSSSAAQAAMDPKAMGVQGIHDLELQNGVLTSKGKNVKLGGGVRMILHVDIFG